MISSIVFRSLDEAAGRGRPCALAIGNFDGVHLGHQSLLARTVQLADRSGVTPAALTFHPHPTTVVAPERIPLNLCSFEERLARIAEAGVQEITVLPFTAEIARLSPEAFVQQVLIAALQAKIVVVGENFRFGCRQSGNARTLQELGERCGFETYLLPPVLYRGEIVSSSAIRQYLNTGALTRANRLLGRCFSIAGPVVSGQGIGSKQTVPTLNLRRIDGQLTPRGVFITETFEASTGRSWQSITNVGNRPTFAGEEVTIETFLLSALKEPAPEYIRVEFRHFIRAERAFPDAPSLRAQIMQDVARAQAYWRRARPVRTAAPSIY